MTPVQVLLAFMIGSIRQFGVRGKPFVGVIDYGHGALLLAVDLDDA